ncbi:transcription factor HES-5-like [Poecilia reticulata]|uniref:transcription factor HES-5-like n=1 Tax=Poecilia reticulata TaxID=8081 RepID=UPI0007EC09AA|nr:PREDICTED: transcription factor HES-5-like [Poecilia reticulata]
MAPTTTATMTNSKEHLALNHKLRKPLVEKLRRERINSSIEQLNSLLGPEFLNQQPESKLEKADILEMTVCFLTKLLQQNQQQKKQLNRLKNPKACFDANEAEVSLSSSDQTKAEDPDPNVLWRPW